MRELGEHPPFEITGIRLFNPNNSHDLKAARKMDLDSLYAYNPFATSESDPRRPMTASELKKFIAPGDANHQTRAITDTKASSRRIIGYEYFSRTDQDDKARLPFVRKMVENAGLGETNKTKIFDFNFYLSARESYTEEGMSAVRQGLEEFFGSHPRDGIVFYFGHNDLILDPDDYNIMTAMGATDVGQLHYEHPGTPGTLEKPNDHVLYLDKSHFDGRVNKQDTRPRGYTATSLPTLYADDSRAKPS